MKKVLLLTLFASVSLCCSAQFVLTPSAGLMTEDGPYTILHTGSESENYYSVKKLLESVWPGVEIGELDYEKSFVANAVYKSHSKLPGTLFASDWEMRFKSKVETAEGKIMVSFEDIVLAVLKKGEVQMYIHPTTGRNSMLMDVSGHHYIFNSKGQIGRGAKKYKIMFEDFANNFVKDIEMKLK